MDQYRVLSSGDGMLEEEEMRNNVILLFPANSTQSEMSISEGLAPLAGTRGTRPHDVPKPWNSSLLAPSSLLFLMRQSLRERETGKGEFPPQLTLLELRGRIRAWLSRLPCFMEGPWRSPSQCVGLGLLRTMPTAPLACTNLPSGCNLSS